jgi:hypothetical protein
MSARWLTYGWHLTGTAQPKTFMISADFPRPFSTRNTRQPVFRSLPVKFAKACVNPAVRNRFGLTSVWLTIGKRATWQGCKIFTDWVRWHSRPTRSLPVFYPCCRRQGRLTPMRSRSFSIRVFRWH